jgi:signal-transduction protein with cAMP-binding, CBS, and nucleotidyltransferase domain
MSFSVHVREVMKSPVITIDVMASAKDALQTMQVKNIRRLPVMAKGRMVGIVTDKDIFRTILKSQDLLAEVISESFVVEYKPTYERLADFMLGEMSRPGGR